MNTQCSNAFVEKYFKKKLYIYMYLRGRVRDRDVRRPPSYWFPLQMFAVVRAEPGS